MARPAVIRPQDLAVPAPAGALWRVGVLDASASPPRWSEEQLTAGTWGSVSPDPMRDLAKVAVIDRTTGAVGRAFLRGLGMHAGALAVSADDGVVVAGSSDTECAAAANALIQREARAVVTVGGRVVGADPSTGPEPPVEQVARDLGSEASDPVRLLLDAVATGDVRLTPAGPVHAATGRPVEPSGEHGR